MADEIPTSSQPGPSGSIQPNMPAELKLQFGRLQSRKRRVTLTVDPGLLTRVFRSTFNSASLTFGLMFENLIEEAPFIRMMRTLTLKRLHDIVESQSGVRAPNPLALGRALDVPQPVGELLYALGTYYSEWNGIQYHLGYPPRPAQNIPDWQTIDPNIVATYRQFVDVTRERYSYVPFPKPTDILGHPLMFCVKDERDEMCQVMAPGPVPKPSDAYLRFVNEEFFTNPPFQLNQCEFYLTERLYIDEIVQMYTSSYVRHAGV